MPSFNVQFEGAGTTASALIGQVVTIPVESKAGQVLVHVRVQDATEVSEGVVELTLYASDEWEASVAMVQCMHEGYVVFAADKPRCAGGRHAGCSETVSELLIQGQRARVFVCSDMIENGVLPFHRAAIHTAHMCRTLQDLDNWRAVCPESWVEIVDLTLAYFDRSESAFLEAALRCHERTFGPAALHPAGSNYTDPRHDGR